MIHKHPLAGSQYMSREQLDCASHRRPKYPGGQVVEQFVPMKPGSHSSKDIVNQTMIPDKS